jgi:nucleoside-diphosphate-sugar epimerase
MASRVLITGGAGFIGSHLADELLQHGYEVRVLDSLHEQVHGKTASRPGYLLTGDVRDSIARSRLAWRRVGCSFWQQTSALGKACTRSPVTPM